MTCVLGIDIGSYSSKGVLLCDHRIAGTTVTASGGDYRSAARRVRDALFSRTGVSQGEVVRTVATGYGAKMVPFADEIKTDISCHSRGVFHLAPSVRTVVDVGDLHSKAMRIDEGGNQLRFVLSGKCAGGSARVLKVIARVVQVNLVDLGSVSLTSRKRVEFNTGCAVFAESEAISRIAEGAAKEDLLAGIHRALAAQLFSLAERVVIKKDLGITGGGAKDTGLVRALEEIAGFEVVVPRAPDLTAALGAALLAARWTAP